MYSSQLFGGTRIINFQSSDIKLVKIGEEAKLLGKHPHTLRGWETEGMHTSIRNGKKGARWFPNHNPIERAWQFLLRNSLRLGEDGSELRDELRVIPLSDTLNMEYSL